MSISIILYVLSDFPGDIIALNIQFSEKKIILNQKYFNYQACKTSQNTTEVYNYNKHKVSGNL